MDAKFKDIAYLERLNYMAMLPTAQVTPDLELEIKDNVILSRSEAFPTPDTNHACLLQSSPEDADALIAEIVGHFKSKDLPPTVFISPACTPTDLPERLLKRGFVKQKEEEAWMLLEDIGDFVVAKPAPKIAVKQIEKRDALTFAEVFLTAFDMPSEYAPYMAQLIEPSIGLPNIYHYVAFIDAQAVGVCSLLCYQNVGIIGSAGVVPVRRGAKVLNNLAFRVREDARKEGLKIGLLQTTAGGLFERFLRISGFKNVFTRTCYMLP